MKSEAIRGNRRLLRYAGMLLASVCYIGQPRTSAAVTLGPVFQLADHVSGESPVAASLGAGRFVAVANRSAGNGGDDNGLRIQRFTRDGELLGGAITIPERYYLYPGQYGVAADAAGNFVVVWLSSAPQGRTRILARRFNADAVAQGPDITVGSSLGLLDVADPSVAMAANGHFVVTWSRGATTDGGLPLYGCIANLPVSLTESDLRYRVYDVSGQPSTVERLAVERVGVSAGITLLCRFQLAATLSNPGSGTSLKQSAVAMDPDGGFNIAWVTRNASELQFNSSQWSTNPSTVQLQHYDGRGNVQGRSRLSTRRRPSRISRSSCSIRGLSQARTDCS